MKENRRVVMLTVCDFKYLPPAQNEAILVSERGYDVDVYTLDDNREVGTQIINSHLRVRRIQLLTRALPKTFFFWVLKYLEYVLRFLWSEIPRSADVYVAHNFDALLPVFIAARLKRVRAIYRAHELFFDAYKLHPERLLRWIEGQLTRRVDAVVLPNEERAEIMFREYSMREKPAVIMNCPPYSETPKTTLLRTALYEAKLPSSFIVLFQGRIIGYNGVEQLLASVQYFDPGISVVLLGPAAPEYTRVLDMIIKRSGVADRVLLHSPVPYALLAQYTASADVGVALYQNTGRNTYFCAPNKLFEYFMAGLPVVSSDFPCLRRFVSLDGCGITVPPDSPVDIANAINALYRSPTMAAAMRANACKSAKRFNWDVEGGKLISIYGGLLG